ncbi:hypothetical protein ATCC90586_001441 [Pythium insidiosum]|nr:hypothetical protein ATCC90586_001441 [Pythium insidiosum]
MLAPDRMQLVLPVVDCSSSAIVFEDATAAKFFYLVRVRDTSSDPWTAALLVVTVSNQGYSVLSRNSDGVHHSFALSIGYPFEQFKFQVYELLGSNEDNFWILRSIPPDPTVQAPKMLLTACRNGVYVKAETEQSNVNNLLWHLRAEPTKVVTLVEFYGAPVVRDSWAWVHFFHIVLAGQVLFNVVVLLLVSFRNVMRVGTYWLGDSFVAVSTSLVWRGLLVILSWVLNKAWALREFGLYDGSLLSAAPDYFCYEQIMHADLITLYLSIVGLIGKKCVAHYKDAITRRVKRAIPWKTSVHAVQINPSEPSYGDHDGKDSSTANSIAAGPPRTQFEIATGATLANQFGLVCDYDNYVFIKGLRFASADGIYSNGFVIANRKFLVQIDDLTTIFFMKLFRVRFRNVYAYDVDGYSVQEMARLVYPDTMSYRDLFSLSIHILT